jgi:hypothetical protein
MPKFHAPINLTNNKLTNLANGTANTDAINLGQLNSALTGTVFGNSTANPNTSGYIPV